MNNIIKLTILATVLIFLIMFFTSSSGYYEYELNKKTNLTNDAILKFEQDIKDGKEIDINNYVVQDNKDYSNKFSNAGISLSNKIKKIFSEGVKFIFNSIGDMVDE